jgi:hypothetical protein
LLLAVTVLAALGIISLTGIALARAERVAGQAALARVQARGAAESALARASLGWESWRTPIAPGATVELVQFSEPGPAMGKAELRALGGPIYALEASGVRLSNSGDSLGVSRLELLVILRAPDSVGMVRPKPYPRGWRSLP